MVIVFMIQEPYPVHLFLFCIRYIAYTDYTSQFPEIEIIMLKHFFLNCCPLLFAQKSTHVLGSTFETLSNFLFGIPSQKHKIEENLEKPSTF